MDAIREAFACYLESLAIDGVPATSPAPPSPGSRSPYVASALPLVSATEVVRALQRAGFEPHHRKGSHITMKQTAEPHRRVGMPMHDPIRRCTLQAIVHGAPTAEEFVTILFLRVCYTNSRLLPIPASIP